MKEVIIESNGTQICAEPINERVQQGAYNSMNWHRFSEMIRTELKKHQDVDFILDQNDREFGAYTFHWRDFLYTSVEGIHLYVMLIVRQCFATDAGNTAPITVPLYR